MVKLRQIRYTDRWDRLQQMTIDRKLHYHSITCLVTAMDPELWIRYLSLLQKTLANTQCNNTA